MPPLNDAVDIAFRLPGRLNGLFYERLHWKIAPLVTSLAQRGYRVKCVQSADPQLADINIWIANEAMPQIDIRQRNILWFCHRMLVLPWVELNSFEGLMSTSLSHSNYLKFLCQSEKPAVYLPWPIDLTETDVQRDVPNVRDWSVMWNILRSRKLMDDEQWVVAHSDRFKIFGQSWTPHLGSAFPAMPVGTTLATDIAGANGYWAVDLLRNRASGFLDGFALYAMAHRKRVYSDRINDLPKTLDRLVQQLDFGTPETDTILAERPAALSRTELRRVRRYFASQHDPEHLADRVVRMFDRIGKRSTRTKVRPDASVSGVLHLFQDSTLDQAQGQTYANTVSAAQAAAHMAQDAQARLVFHPTAPDRMPAADPSLPLQFSIQYAAINRLRAIDVALRYKDRVEFAPPTAPGPLVAPVHDLTDLLFRAQDWTQGKHDPEFINDLSAALEQIPEYSEFLKKDVTALSAMWHRVAAQTFILGVFEDPSFSVLTSWRGAIQIGR